MRPALKRSGVTLPAPRRKVEPIPASSVTALVAALSHSHPARIPSAVAAVLTAHPGVEDSVVWVADLGHSHLRDLRTGVTQAIDGTPAGRALIDGEVIAAESGMLIPIMSLGRSLGVLELIGPGSRDLAGEATELSTVIADRLIGSKGQSDVIERARGAGALDLASTIQHELMPIPSYADPEVELGGRIEPAYDIAGDSYDYAVNEDGVHLAVFDAVGHGLRATLLTTIAMGSYRLHRRRGLPLEGIAGAVEETLGSASDTGEFVTAILGFYDPGAGSLRVWSAGHPPPIVIRGGIAEEVALTPALPFGLGGHEGEPTEVPIRSGDSVYLFSDGVTEACDGSRTRFGVEALIQILTREENATTTVPRICRDVLATVRRHAGSRLADDATLLGLRVT